MDVMIHNVEASSTYQPLRDFLKGPLQSCGIQVFNCQKPKGKSYAFLTIGDTKHAEGFLAQYGSQLGQAATPLWYFGRRLDFKRSTKIPSTWAVKSLQLEEQNLLKEAQKKQNNSLKTKVNLERRYPFKVLQAGAWTYCKSQLTFDRHFEDKRGGSMIFGSNSLTIELRASSDVNWTCRLEVPYLTIEHTIIDEIVPEISFTLTMPPRIFQIDKSEIQHLLPEVMRLLSVQESKVMPSGKRSRLCSINAEHQETVGTCMVYRLCLCHIDMLGQVQSLFQYYSNMPALTAYTTPSRYLSQNMSTEFHQLFEKLAKYDENRYLPYEIRFQVYRLATNCCLPPALILDLLSWLDLSIKESTATTEAFATAIYGLDNQIATPGPDVEAEELSLPRIKHLIQDNVIAYQGSVQESMRLLLRSYEHLIPVFKATVTPTGLILQGPDYEVSNRVLRKYRPYSEYFLRVTFADEDLTPVHFDLQASHAAVLHGRFKRTLEEGLSVAGRTYKFLGFSHSSLRSQTCWFMADFWHMMDNRWFNAADVILEIGDFSHFRSPPKCAARIGQAFSDTMPAASVMEGTVEIQNDVERNGRVFSDGCGTISWKLIRKVWSGYALGRRLQVKPTTLQIRYAGAKGVVSLDKTLSGERMRIRKSMQKFTTNANENDIEICGAAYKPLPMFLNRQFIKILEDLGIHPAIFLDLQAERVNELKEVTLSAINAANFLNTNNVGVSAKTPMFIKLLHDIGLPFKTDQFLTNMVEVTALGKVRDIKYRGRILVDKGLTLYGIMDEWDELREGEVFVTTKTVNDQDRIEDFILVQDRVVITRAPALHPGDIQTVKAVDVRQDSPLKKLYNCVVFSQQGQRDLPSQLSGGDLDGDLYNIIWDPDLVPKSTHEPADYPRVESIDIRRVVTTKDITDFFIHFMESDRLGQISTMHQTFADRSPNGTLHKDCIVLAEMASTAVDFSKSGIPVDMAKAPKSDRYRPDFMAPGPKAFIDKGVNIQDLEDDSIDAESASSFQVHYYLSDKVLGQLYRAINENKIFQQMHDENREFRREQLGVSLMQRLWKYIQRQVPAEVQVAARSQTYVNLARDLRNSYESNLLQVMQTYGTDPRSPSLTELEVFSGIILGKNQGVINKRVREVTKEMVERFNRDAEFVVNHIKKGGHSSDEYDNVGALSRALACFDNAMTKTSDYYERQKLQSWRVVTAAVCLEELWKFYHFSLPPLDER